MVVWISPTTLSSGISVVTINGKVTRQRDYFYAGQLFYENVPILGGVIRLLKQKIGRWLLSYSYFYTRNNFQMSLRLVGIFLLISTNLFGQGIEFTYKIKGDTTREYYATVHPAKEVRGVLILLPGFGELPKQTLVETDIHKVASEAGYLTIIPALSDWSFFYIDNASHEKLNRFIDDVFKKYELEGKAFIIGGFSFGGTMAFQYAQQAYAGKSALRKPVAVFGVDPPLDIERLYDCMTTTNRPTKNPISVQEDDYVAERIEKEFGVSPKKKPELFWEISPFAQSDPGHTGLKSLVNVPVRIYNEPDINWYIENRSIDLYCINSVDSAAMINWLRHFGNTQAELILTTNKGRRVARQIRHPHSWTIVNGTELIAWINGITTDKRK